MAELERPVSSHPVPSDVTPTQPATEAWAAVLTKLRHDLPGSALTFFIDPCDLVGEHKRSLVIASESRYAEWVRRRYAKPIAKTIREITDYRGLFVCDKP